MFILKNIEEYIPKLDNSNHENNGIFLFAASKKIQADMAINEYIKMTYENNFNRNLKNKSLYGNSLDNIEKEADNTSCFCSIECKIGIEYALKEIFEKGIKLKNIINKMKLIVIINDELSFINSDLEPDGFVVQFILSYIDTETPVL